MSDEKTSTMITQNLEFKVPSRKLNVPLTKSSLKTLQKYFMHFYHIASENVTGFTSEENSEYRINVYASHLFTKKQLIVIVDHLNLFFDNTKHVVKLAKSAMDENNRALHTFKIVSKNDIEPKKTKTVRKKKNIIVSNDPVDNSVNDLTDATARVTFGQTTYE